MKTRTLLLCLVSVCAFVYVSAYQGNPNAGTQSFNQLCKKRCEKISDRGCANRMCKDEMVCTFKKNLEKWKCSCPSHQRPISIKNVKTCVNRTTSTVEEAPRVSNVVPATPEPSTLDTFVREVQQNYNERFDSKLVQLLNKYQTLELIYMAYAAYYKRADVALPGFNKYFRDQSKHMREQGNGLMAYINERGGYVVFSTIKMDGVCSDVAGYLSEYQVTNREAYICDFQMKDNKIVGKDVINKPGLYGLQDALAMEKDLHATIYKDLEDGNIDPFSKHHMESLLVKERIFAMRSLVDRLLDYVDAEEEYILAEYEMDMQFAK